MANGGGTNRSSPIKIDQGRLRGRPFFVLKQLFGYPVNFAGFHWPRFAIQFHSGARQSVRRRTRDFKNSNYGSIIDTSVSSRPTTKLLAYPGYGFQLPDGRWSVGVSGVAWKSPVVFNRRQKMIIRMLGGVMQATDEDMASELFGERVTPFMTKCKPRPRISVRIGDQQFEFEKKTKSTGRFEQRFLLDDERVQSLPGADTGVIDYEISVSGAKFLPEEKSEFTASGKICLIPTQGISIVSDIDDTIKETCVGNRHELLHNTFLREFKSVPEMAEIYQQWASLGSSFHYVSASPWQMFESLNLWRKDGEFPFGTFHLRNFRLRDQLLKKVILHRKGKRSAIQKLIRNLPGRRYILIGDSGEKDPEIYCKVSRKFPGNIVGIFIRQLPDHPIDPDRWQKICDDAPGAICERFTGGKDLQEKVARLFES